MKSDFFTFVSIYNHFLFATVVFYLLAFYHSFQKIVNIYSSKCNIVPYSKVFLSIWILGKNKFIKRGTVMGWPLTVEKNRDNYFVKI